MNIGGHTNLAIKLLNGTYTTLGSFLGMRKVVRNTHHIDGKLNKSAQVLILDITGP